MNRFYFAFLLLSSSSSVVVKGQGDPLRQPPVIESSNGLLDTNLSIEYATINGPFFSLINTRLFNGMLPGPTLRLDAGDTLKVLYDNKLEAQAGTTFGENELTNPDHSNLHYHGAHVSGELPSDDVRFSIAPGDSFQYETDFPGNHMPGTHWIHPHGHGSSTIQVGGGAAMALIVNDPPGSLPSQVEDAEEVLLFVQHMDLQELDRVISNHNDGVFGLEVDNTNVPMNFRLVNGQYQPVLSMQPGEWQRWRIVMAGWLGNELDFQIDNASCEMHLLSKDGIYIQDFPRQLSVLPIPAGGRADVMVRCASEGTYNVMDFGSSPLMTINVAGTPVSSAVLQEWTPTYPSYLTDLQNTPADPGCSCATAFDRCEDDRRNLFWWNDNDGDGDWDRNNTDWDNDDGDWDGNNDGDWDKNNTDHWDGHHGGDWDKNETDHWHGNHGDWDKNKTDHWHGNHGDWDKNKTDHWDGNDGDWDKNKTDHWDGNDGDWDKNKTDHWDDNDGDWDKNKTDDWNGNNNGGWNGNNNGGWNGNNNGGWGGNNGGWWKGKEADEDSAGDTLNSLARNTDGTGESEPAPESKIWWLFGGGGDRENDGDDEDGNGGGGGNWDGDNDGDGGRGNGGGGGGNDGDGGRGNGGGGGGNWNGGNGGGGGGGNWNGGNANRRTCINGRLFDKHVYLHTIAFGSVVERHLSDVDDHPYHQHVYPFQFVSSSGIRDAAHAAYYQVGDWQDTIQLEARNVAVRYRADVHEGTIMLHCHILEHEDMGVMAQEMVVDGGECSCNAFATITSDTPTTGGGTTEGGISAGGGLPIPEELSPLSDLTLSAAEEQLGTTSGSKRSLISLFAAAAMSLMTVFLLA